MLVVFREQSVNKCGYNTVSKEGKEDRGQTYGLKSPHHHLLVL